MKRDDGKGKQGRESKGSEQVADMIYGRREDLPEIYHDARNEQDV